jgi:hypothetical protein
MALLPECLNPERSYCGGEGPGIWEGSCQLLWMRYSKSARVKFGSNRRCCFSSAVIALMF